LRDDLLPRLTREILLAFYDSFLRQLQVPEREDTFVVICWLSSSSLSMLMREEDDTARGRFGGILIRMGGFNCDDGGGGVAVVLVRCLHFPTQIWATGMVTKPVKIGRLVNF